MTMLNRLEQIIAERRTASPDTSYVAKLNHRGLPVMAQKLGEEAVETVIAALSGERKDVISESADLLFHLLVLLAAKDISLDDVMAELERREGTSGIAEKAARTENTLGEA
ncbi:phosphoribosyl-ATP diphosphatase [Altericroceibacterium endophyticum]|uniref:Phosphoribosyl-ATP pyrophosphatase n=1 Tax=Altericroceibacterium endophyticum TaxID=1808508 RepID=A0A6I4T977_9SPHN|nr:phosphoribosyl-ATP diphosphatase [Altericroceibacterium endophyticum]MXO66949.1 phosphoribosyl-ATP diphosphatase [Altericroceibacterium endophyticum]